MDQPTGLCTECEDQVSENNTLELGETAMDQVVGYCKECGKQVFKSGEIAGYKEIYECPNCYHPHTKSELWDSKPDYIVD